VYRIVAIKMVLQVAVRDIGQLTDLALEPDEPVVRRLTGRVGRSWAGTLFSRASDHGPFGQKGFKGF